MNATKKLLNDLKQAIVNGQLSATELPVEEIKNCVFLEIETSKMSYTSKQFEAVERTCKDFCAHFEEGAVDEEAAIILIDGLLIALETISDSVYSLINGDYWREKYSNRLDDPDISGIIDYIDRKRNLQLISYDFMDEYSDMHCQVGTDNETGMAYVVHKGRRMFFPRFFDETAAVEYYRTICAEQDMRSPHCYNKEGFLVKNGDVIADCGAAEGFFSLEHLDEASEIYLFDADKEWIEALEKTFEEYRDKVHIIYGFVGNVSDGYENITLDDVLEGKKVDYIKMDIEGAEKDALNGARKLIAGSEHIRCAICSYHCEDDERFISEFFEEHKMEHATSGGYMFPDWCCESIVNASLRRGVVFGSK